MRLEYRTRYLDYLIFNLLHQFLSVRLQVVYLLVSAFIGWTWIDHAPLGVCVAISAMAYVVFWLGQVLFTGIFLASRRSDSNLTDHVVEVRNDALYESTKYNETRFFWPGVLRVVRLPGYVAVYVARQLAHVIPNRAFSSRRQIAEFVEYARTRMKSAPTSDLAPATHLTAKEGGTFELHLREAQLLIIRNALNEVCNGIDLFEFETRMGASRAEVTALLSDLQRV